jgi:hypothetical protein
MPLTGWGWGALGWGWGAWGWGLGALGWGLVQEAAEWGWAIARSAVATASTRDG